MELLEFEGDDTMGMEYRYRHLKKNILTFIFILLSGRSFSQLNLTVEGIKKDNGTILVAIYNSKTTFNNIREVFREGRIKVEGNKAGYCFKDLPAGDYAISIFHDVNDNQALDKNNLGIPIEPYGFSNNAEATFGPPSFKKAEFRYSGEQMDITIRVK